MKTWLARLGLPAALLLLAMAYDVPSSCDPGDAACQAAAFTDAPPVAPTAEQTSVTSPEGLDGLATAWSHGMPALDDVALNAAYNAAYTVDFDIAGLSSALSIDEPPGAFGPLAGFSLPSQAGGGSEPASPALLAFADELRACMGEARCGHSSFGGGSSPAAAPGGDQPTTPTEGQNVPEPSVILLLAISLVAVGMVVRTRSGALSRVRIQHGRRSKV